MSADANLQPEQFGNYTIQHDPLSYRTVTATTKGGTNAGYLMWDKPDPNRLVVDPTRPTISSIKVGTRQRGKGLAGAMLDHALKHAPDLQHDHALTPDGKRFAERHPL